MPDRHQGEAVRLVVTVDHKVSWYSMSVVLEQCPMNSFYLVLIYVCIHVHLYMVWYMYIYLYMYMHNGN